MLFEIILIYLLVGVILVWSKGITIALTKSCVLKVLTWPVWAKKD